MIKRGIIDEIERNENESRIISKILLCAEENVLMQYFRSGKVNWQ